MASAAQSVSAAHLTPFEAMISGDQENPGSGSPATGMLMGEYDSNENSFSFSWTISDDLIGMPSSPGAHLHLGAAGVNGPVVFGFNEPDGTWALSGSATWTGLSTGEVDALFAGEVYINFHTDQFPGGEVRGQIYQVPAPGALAVAGMGLAGLSRRRR